MPLLNKFEDTVSSWPQISVHPHQFSAREFRFGKAEVGHVDDGGIVDIPFPRTIRDALLAEGLAEAHHWVPNSGWATFRLRSDKDLQHAVWLMRLSYFRYALKSAPDPRKMFAEASRELHLTDPPLLDEVGLVPALRSYVDGFSERSKIKVEFEIGQDFGRLSLDTETAIFRIVQESLTNIHRHSESSVASIRISRGEDSVSVEIEDHGKGISPEKQSPQQAGVGIRGMRERVRQLGGTFEIRSSSGGTLVQARLPAEKPRAATTDQTGASRLPKQWESTPARSVHKA